MVKKKGSTTSDVPKKDASTTSVATKGAESTTSVVTKGAASTTPIAAKNGTPTTPGAPSQSVMEALAKVNASTRTEPDREHDIAAAIYESRKPAVGKWFIVVAIIVLALIVVAGVASFGLILSESKDDSSQIKVFEDHKTQTSESVEKAIKVVRTFSDLGNDINLDDLSTKLFKYIRHELELDKLNKTEHLSQREIKSAEEMVESFNTTDCNPPKTLIMNKTQFMELVNGSIDTYNRELKTLGKPVDESQANLNRIITEESNKPGRLTNRNIVGYGGNITTMISDYNTSTVTRNDAFIKSTQDQMKSRDSAKLGHFITTIGLFSVSLIFLVVIAVLAFFYQKRKIKLYSLKLYSNILMGIAIFIAFALLIIAILSLIGISLFSYDCEMKTPSQNSDKNFYTFDGKAVNIGKITGGCEKGSSIYTKMDANFNGKSVEKYLDEFQSNVENFASTLHHFSGDLNFDDLSDVSASLTTQLLDFGKMPTDTCLQKPDRNTLNDIISIFRNCRDGLENLQKIAENILQKDMRSKAKTMVQDSFKSLRNDSLKLVDSINSQLTKTDIKCYQEMPHGLCDEKTIYSRNVIIVNWILFGVYVLLAILAKLLFLIPQLVISADKSAERKLEEAKKKEEAEKKKRGLSSSINQLSFIHSIIHQSY
ncbi:unnamed protein product [Caenorhabditis angaria]|uniref:Uncharacterized protein n=1 Tax=Caenorhabditis angaria TaxID=860376 RepID=A0A9P1IAQ3_9PELO|nr:unnamed protein product [Caenorhabditis angaria]